MTHRALPRRDAIAGAVLSLYPLAGVTFLLPCDLDIPEERASLFHITRECAGQIGDDLRVEVPPGQRRSGQAGTESCGRRGDAPSEA